MAFELKVTWHSPWGEGEQVFRDVADALIGTLSDYSEAWQKVAADVLAPVMAQQFETEGAALGEPWAPLLDATVKRRKRGGYPPEHPILERDGFLKRSFEEGGDDHIEDINETSMEWGSANVAAPHHQRGTKHMVARPIINMNADLRLQIVNAVNKVIQQKLRDNNFDVNVD